MAEADSQSPASDPKPEAPKPPTSAKSEKTAAASAKRAQPAAAEQTPAAKSASKPTADQPAAKPAASKPAAGRGKKKAKEPEKPFQQAIEEDVIPLTVTAFRERGVDDLDLRLDGQAIRGTFAGGRRKFDIFFSEPSLTANKAFTYAIDGGPTSLVESFMIDERKVPPALVSFYIVQRIYAQQWF